MSWHRRTLLGGLAATCCGGAAMAQWPGGNQSSPEAPTTATALKGCMIGSLSQIHYTLFGDSKEELFIEDVFDWCSGCLDLVDGTMVLFDGPDSYNALATPENLVLQRGEGTVLLGRQLIAFHKKNFGSRWGSALAASLAHEVGHLVQYKRGLRLPTRTAELHADYLAGWALERFRLKSGLDKFSDTSVARQSLYLLQSRMRDDAVHGSADDRVRAFDAGRDYALGHLAHDELKEVPVDPGLEFLGGPMASLDLDGDMG